MAAALIFGEDQAAREAYVRQLAQENNKTLHLLDNGAPDLSAFAGDDVWLFAPEASTIPLELQTRILHAAQERTVGLIIMGAEGSPNDFMESIYGGKFREDLYYRASYNTIELGAAAEPPQERRAAVTESLLALPPELLPLLRTHPTLIDLFHSLGSPRPLETDLNRLKARVDKDADVLLDYGRVTKEAFEAFVSSPQAQLWNQIPAYVPLDDTVINCLKSADLGGPGFTMPFEHGAGEEVGVDGMSRVLSDSGIENACWAFDSIDSVPPSLAPIRDALAEASSRNFVMVVTTTA